MAGSAYSAEFRRKVLDLLAAGRRVVDLARDLEVSDQIYNWCCQDLIDRGLLPGLTTSENAELARVKKRVAALEAELAATQRAMELVRGDTPVPSSMVQLISRRGFWEGSVRDDVISRSRVVVPR